MIRTAVLAGVAAVAAMGTALAASHSSHMMKISLPDGMAASCRCAITHYLTAMPETPTACYNLAARRHARALTRLYDRHLAPAGVSSSQFSILAVTARGEAMTIANLARAMVMERTTLMRAVSRLEAEGLMDRHQPEGARGIVLTLTVAGRDKLATAAPLWRAAQEAYEMQVGKEDAARLRDDLQRHAFED
ncbi:MarR family winged helix-turn-helix transcriptional regulator [Sphingobium sp. Sx8-8]|uniref:MarR family winged helix-turn-helix transcriptional regulator n=1 Tax=Sphingobium sp. Sx8-8 TaxID=2933617 RepID=UPI001F5AB494|nr:MarR family winged helix-turn-helix transcriptional regulator [Sphingobium sp. Sx8-8]